MGKSYTVHCVGLSPSREYYAMSKMEIAQANHRAKKNGDQIIEWYAQTKTGVRILGANDTNKCVPAEKIKLPKMVTCPICEGRGKNGKYSCPVCNFSGITRPGYEKKWRPWQLESMRGTT